MMRFSRVVRCPAAVASLKKKLRVRHALHACPKRVISRADFHSLCSSPVIPADERMTTEELDAFLGVLHDARIVLLLDENTVHLRPRDALDEVHDALDVPRLQHLPEHEANEHSSLRLAVDNHERRGEAAIVKTARFRKRFWSSVALGSGMQMLGLSYLTFVKYDWDVMEPACFFVTAGTSIVFYMYLLLFRREHSLQAVDENLLPKHLDQALQAAGVDAHKWAQDAQRLNELENEKKKK